MLAEDRGDELVLRPAPSNPVEAVRGIFAADVKGGPTIDEARARGRVEEAELEDARIGRGSRR